MSQPWQEAPGTAGQSGSASLSPLPGAPNAWSPDRVNAADPPWAAAEPDHLTTARDSAEPAQGVPAKPAAKLTGRGAIAVMFTLFLAGLLVSVWLGWGLLAGLSFVAGSVAAAWYTNQRDLLTVAVSPPLLFLVALLAVKALTATGSAVISTAEGTVLTLANVAPWLFAGMLISLIIAWCRGLRRCVAELRRDLRPDLARRRPGNMADGSGRPSANRSA